MNKVTIVMYHYVRELAKTRFPKINGLNLSSFREQVAYMQRFYKFVTAQECIDAIYGGNELPDNAVLLTFDDGYSDHFNNVFPILDSLGIQGCFFPPVCAVRDGRVLDENKIHFILANVKTYEQLRADVFDTLDLFRSEGWDIISNEEMYSKLAIYNEFDPPFVVFIKQLLQCELPLDLRTRIIDKLFKRYVSDDEHSFASELYLSEDQLRMMVRHGMIVGSHGDKHVRLNTLSPSEQQLEIESSLEFLQSIGCSMENWQMCYPHGAYDDSLIKICADLGCGIGYTVEVDIATLSEKNALLLPRLDTNHLPKKSDSVPNTWTKSII